MFKYDMTQNNFPRILLGLFDLDQFFISTIKSLLNANYKDSINYLEIKKNNLTNPKTENNKESNNNELGMISLNWLENILKVKPSLIIHTFDVTYSFIDEKNVNIDLICKPIFENIYLIKKFYKDANQLLIIKNFNKFIGIDNNIKTHILNNINFDFNENNIFLINDVAYLDNDELMKQIIKLIINNSIAFYDSKIQIYLDKYNYQKNNQQKEYEIKYLIKLYLLAQIKNILVEDKNLNYYEFIKNAYEIVSQLNKIEYMFSGDNLKMKYIEIKNLADFLLNRILIEKKEENIDIFNLLLRHLFIFDYQNFFGNNKKEINNKSINEFKKFKDISFINMKLKFSWLQYLSEINEKDKNNSINNLANIHLMNSHKLNNLFHLYIFLKNEQNLIQEKYSNINKEIPTKKIKVKFLEKVPKISEIKNDNIENLLSDEENLELYISEIILENKNIIEPQYILKLLKEYFTNNDLNYYDFYLINKHCKDNEFNEDFNNILIKIIYKESNIITKFSNVHSHITNKINKIILDSKLDKEEKENNDFIFNIIKYYINYFNTSDKSFSKEQINKFNEILSCDINSKSNQQIIYLNGFVNKLFNIQINYDLQEISLLDTVNMSIDIYSLKDDLLFNIEKIVLYFPKDKYIKENNKKIKEILINKELTKDNPIKINYKYFIDHIFNKLYITNIELHLKNKIIISIYNKEQKYFILYNKNSNEKNIDDIIDIDLINYNKKNTNAKIILGKNENHLLYIKYNLKKDNEDIYIKSVKINIELDKVKNYEFKILDNDNNNYQISENKQLNYEYINANLEKNLPVIDYILTIGELGNFSLNYNFNFILINKNFPDDKCSLEFSKNIKVESIESFIFTNKIMSQLYFIDNKTKLKSYPINYPINIISFIKNKLSKRIIIHKIEYLLSSDSLEINCPTEKIFAKIKNYKINFSKDDKISINAKIISKVNISGSIGKLNIFWTSEDLYKNKFFKEAYINNSIFDICNINISQLSLIMEEKYIKMYNKYQICIKNLENTSKMIQFNIKEENKDEKYFLCGKTNFKELMTPNKEIKILYNIYDRITGGSIEEFKENDVYKFNNVFILNEYNISDKKDKFKEDYLKNIIYFSPELFKLTN